MTKENPVILGVLLSQSLLVIQVFIAALDQNYLDLTLNQPMTNRVEFVSQEKYAQ